MRAGMAVHVPEERLLPGVHDLHGPAGAQGEQAGVDVEAHVLPGAERAAHPAEGQPHQLGREAEALRHLVAVVVEPLGRHDEVDAAVLGREREPGLGAHERLVLHADLVGALDHHRPAPARRRPCGCAARGTRCRPGWRGGAASAASGVGDRVEDLVVDDDGVAAPVGRCRGGRRPRPRSARRCSRTTSSTSTGWSRCSSPKTLLPGRSVGGEHGRHAGDAERRADVDARGCGPRGAATGGHGPTTCRRPRGRR